MNCLTEALGLSLPGNGTIVATHADRRRLFVEAGHLDRRSRAPLLRAGRRERAAAHHRQLQGVRERDDARHRHGRLDQHGAASARRRARGRGRLHHGRHRPAVAPRAGAVQGRAVGRRRACRGRASRRRHHGHPRRTRPRRADQPRRRRWCTPQSLEHALARWDIKRSDERDATREFFRAAPGGVPTQVAFSQASRYEELDEDRENGVIRDAEHAFSQGRRPRRALRQSRASTAAS